MTRRLYNYDRIGSIYIVEVGEGQIKIGWSHTPRQRIRSYQTANKMTRVIDTRHGFIQEQERSLHKILRDKYPGVCGGEVYKPRDKWAFVEDVQTTILGLTYGQSRTS